MSRLSSGAAVLGLFLRPLVAQSSDIFGRKPLLLLAYGLQTRRAASPRRRSSSAAAAGAEPVPAGLRDLGVVDVHHQRSHRRHALRGRPDAPRRDAGAAADHVAGGDHRGPALRRLARRRRRRAAAAAGRDDGGVWGHHRGGGAVAGRWRRRSAPASSRCSSPRPSARCGSSAAAPAWPAPSCCRRSTSGATKTCCGTCRPCTRCG